jgi:hypothetical protein
MPASGCRKTKKFSAILSAIRHASARAPGVLAGAALAKSNMSLAVPQNKDCLALPE